MILHFPELLCFFFELVELIEGFGLNFFESIELPGGDVNCLVYFGVLFA
jgi:hypothetical protein